MDSAFLGKRILVTGGAGFIGSHLVDRLLAEEAEVTAADNFITGNKRNLAAAETNARFHFIEADVSKPPSQWLHEAASFDFVFHLASPASPDGYMQHPVETYMVNAMGTHHLLEWMKTTGGKFLFTSTSETYGDPLEHPQKETYFGNVNPVGPRACYDESKRFGEMVVSTFAKTFGVDARIVRIFNTYGPRMDLRDGRVIPAYLDQALHNQPITVHDSGEQTRSFCYVDDLVEYLLRAMSMASSGEVINIGNPDEHTMRDTAEIVKRLTGASSEIVFVPGREEDPKQRKPDISKAKQLLAYEPQTSLEVGLTETISYFRKNLDE